MDKKVIIKKSIIVILKICIAVFLFMALNLLFMPKYIEKNTDGRITPDFYREKAPVDVIFTGSSLVHAGISPMELYRDYGITSYDRSNSSQTIALSYYVAEEVIKHNKPRLIVADVGFAYETADFVDEGASRKSLDGMKWSSSKYKAIKAMISPDESFTDYVFPILRFHSRWNDLSVEDIKYLFFKPVVTFNGQLLQFDENDPGIAFDFNNLEAGTVACDENIAYLQRLCDLCKANDVQLVFIKMPSVQCKWNSDIDNQINSLAANNGVTFKNFIGDFESIGLDPVADYNDVQHMNAYGAEKFSKVLGSFIIENYNVPVRKDDNKVKAIYDKKLEKYESYINNRIVTYK